MPFGSEIHLAAANPHLLYLGGLAFDGTNAFHMQASLNQGATWQTVLAPTGMSLQNKWFVDATGLLYNAVEGASTPIIWRYNPSTNHWRMLHAPDNAYHLQGVTSAASKGGDILWVSSAKGTLYRGTP